MTDGRLSSHGGAHGSGREFAGEVLQGLLAYNITADKRSGVGDCSDAQLASYLSSAHAQDRGYAAGPMAEAVENSLQYLTSEDIIALVAYLRTVAAQTADYEVIVAPSPVRRSRRTNSAVTFSKVLA